MTLDEANKRLALLLVLPDGWGGSERPNEIAASSAASIIAEMDARGHQVQQIVPMADGGIELEWNSMLVRVHVYNEGDAVVVHERHGQAPTFAELPVAGIVERVAQLLAGGR